MDLTVFDTLAFVTLDAAREHRAAALWAQHEAGDDDALLDELTPASLDFSGRLAMVLHDAVRYYMARRWPRAARMVAELQAKAATRTRPLTAREQSYLRSYWLRFGDLHQPCNTHGGDMVRAGWQAARAQVLIDRKNIGECS